MSAKRSRPKKAASRTSHAHLETSLLTSDRERMEVGCLTEQTRPFQEVLSKRIVGQEEVKEKLSGAPISHSALGPFVAPWRPAW